MPNHRKRLTFVKYTQVPKGVWRWTNFTPQEMSCKGSGRLVVDFEFMDRLQALRDLIGPLAVSSGYRSPEHDTAIGGAGVHPTGRAVDILIHGRQAYLAMNLSGELGFTGVGLKQTGKHEKRFLHLDDLAADETKGPRPWIWTY